MPIEIWSIEDLDDVRTDLEADYVLMRDLDFEDDDSYDDPANKNNYITGGGWNPIGSDVFSDSYSGIFQGNNFSIYNLYINRPSTNKVGFFASSSGYIYNLNIHDADVVGNDYATIFCGYKVSGIINNCSVSGDLVGENYVGGLVGICSYGATIWKCSSDSIITGKNKVGGVVGDMLGGSIYFTYCNGTVTGTHNVGGFGGSGGTMLRSCFSLSDVYLIENIGGNVGGLIGYYTYGDARNCYSKGTVTRSSTNSYTTCGGFIGYNNRSTVLTSYSTGDVIYDGTTNPTDKGFLGGVNTSHPYNMSANFWDIDTSNQSSSVGDVEGKTTVELQTLSTFIDAGWDIIIKGEHNGSLNAGVWYFETNEYPNMWYLLPLRKLISSTSILQTNPYYRNPYIKLENGLKLYEFVLNRHQSSVLLKRQPVLYNVTIGDLVKYDNTSNKWVVAASSYPVGIYMGSGLIVLSGIVYGLNNLIPNTLYWMTQNGKLTPHRTESFNNTYVGKSISNTELLLDISIYGEWISNE